jgi:hypothetical protein
MTDPRRWLDDPSAPDESLALLRSLGGPRPYSEAAHLRIASKVSATLAVAPAAAAASKLAAWKLLTLGGVVGVGAIALVVGLRGGQVPEPAPLPRPVPAAPKAVTPPTPEPLPAPPVVTEPPAKTKAPERLPPRAPVRDDLAVEETLLEQARTAPSPARALALLREHERRFPQGALSAERLFLNAKVHAQSGSEQPARRYAAELERRFPASSYVTRLRAILSERFPGKKP